MKNTISVIIPAYNEKLRLNESLPLITKYMAQNYNDYEIIIVDDGSVDDTFNVIKKYKSKKIKIIQNKCNRGKGYSIKRGVAKSKKELILFTDVDLASPIEELPKLEQTIKQGFDIAFGSRNLKESRIEVNQPWYRRILGKIFPMIVNMIVLHDIKDTQCGFKLFKTSVAKDIFRLVTLDRFAFDVEVLFIAKKKKYKTKEVAVRWISKPGTKVRIIVDSLRMLFDLIRIRINDILKKYNY